MYSCGGFERIVGEALRQLTHCDVIVLATKANLGDASSKMDQRVSRSGGRQAAKDLSASAVDSLGETFQKCNRRVVALLSTSLTDEILAQAGVLHLCNETA